MESQTHMKIMGSDMVFFNAHGLLKSVGSDMLFYYLGQDVVHRLMCLIKVLDLKAKRATKFAKQASC